MCSSQCTVPNPLSLLYRRCDLPCDTLCVCSLNDYYTHANKELRTTLEQDAQDIDDARKSQHHQAQLHAASSLTPRTRKAVRTKERASQLEAGVEYDIATQIKTFVRKLPFRVSFVQDENVRARQCVLQWLTTLLACRGHMANAACAGCHCRMLEGSQWQTLGTWPTYVDPAACTRVPHGAHHMRVPLR